MIAMFELKLQPGTVGVSRALRRGAIQGFAWGVAARVWMRLIAEDPEFSWDGRSTSWPPRPSSDC